MNEVSRKVDLMEEPPEDYFRWRTERQRRLRIIAAAVPAMLALFFLSTAFFLPDNAAFSIFPGLDRRLLALMSALMTVFSGAALLMLYLQYGLSLRIDTTSEYLRYEDALRRFRKRIEHGDNISYNEFELLKQDISILKKELANKTSIDAAISSDQKDELISLLKREIQEEATDIASQEFLDKVKREVTIYDQSKEVEKVFSRTLERLYKETNALGRRGNINLILGIVTTMVGLVILGYFVFEIDSVPEDKVAFIAYFLPRLSLVVLIEVFAYFFLTLYKSSLSEIKYFQNEMTNSEAKLAALKCSLMTNDSATTSNVIKVLSETERNAVLQKGQTTADIEKTKIEQRNIAAIADKVAKILRAK